MEHVLRKCSDKFLGRKGENMTYGNLILYILNYFNLEYIMMPIFEAIIYSEGMGHLIQYIPW